MSAKNFKGTNETQRSTSPIVEKDENGAPSFSQIISSTIIEKNLKLAALKVELEESKKRGHDTSDITDDIKIISNHIDSLSILLHLAQLKNYSTNPQFFEKTLPRNSLGQFYNFNINYALKQVTLPEGEDYSVDIDQAVKSLALISNIINIISESNLYEFIYGDIMPQWNSNAQTVNFAKSKKEIENFVKANNSIFSGTINVNINNHDAKTFCTSLMKFVKSHKVNTVKMVDFRTFLSKFQETITTKINKVEATIAELQK